MVKEIFLLLGFFALALIETSFLIFDFARVHCYLVFIVIFLLIFLDSQVPLPKTVYWLEQDWFFPVFFGGFFLDVFSGGIFGLKTLSLLLATLFLRFLLNLIRKKNIFWLILFFLFSFSVYKFSFFLFESLFERSFVVFSLRPFELIYNLTFAILGFLLINYGFLPLKKRVQEP